MIYLCYYHFRVNNVDKIAFVDKNIAFSSHSDHSKWAISVPTAKSCKTCDKDRWVCVGDINRAVSMKTLIEYDLLLYVSIFLGNSRSKRWRNGVYTKQDYLVSL